jgi:hypothetical protein
MYLPLLYLLFLASCLTHQALGRGRGRPSPEGSLDPSSRITVVGVVYCDTCSINTFSRQSYFLQGQSFLHELSLGFSIGQFGYSTFGL